MSPRIIVLASGTGSLLRSLLGSQVSDYIVALITDVPNCGAVGIAQEAGIPVISVPLTEYSSRVEWDQALLDRVNELEPDLLVTAGFMRILSETFVESYPNRIVNSHPALLPLFPGAHAVRDALAANVTTTGCTIHFVDAGVDTGPIVAQQSIEVQPGESEEHLHERIKVVERELLPRTINTVLADRGLIGDL